MQKLNYVLWSILLLGFLGCSSNKEEIELTETKCQDIPLQTINDQAVFLSEYLSDSQWNIVEFWRGKCPACTKVYSQVASFVAEYQTEVNVISVAVGDWDKSLDFIQASGPSWTQLLDRAFMAQETFQLEYVPTFLLVNSAGYIVMQTYDFSLIKEKVLADK